MIKIDTNNITKWESIEKKHMEWCSKNLKLDIGILEKVLGEYCQEKDIPKTDEINKFWCDVKHLNKNYRELTTSKQLNKIIEKIESNIWEELGKTDKKKIKSEIKELCKCLEEKSEEILEGDGYLNYKNYKIKVKGFSKDIEEEEIREELKVFSNIDLDGFIEKRQEKLDTNDKIFDLRCYKYFLKTKIDFLEIFNYCKIQSNYRHEIISMMGINVCPYCQRNYITSYTEEDEKKTTADLDHFYPKSKYPYLALSLYNFIPSCQICNSRMKGTEDTIGSIYPYENSFDDMGAKFKTDKNLVESLLNDNKKGKFKVTIKATKLKEVQKSIKIFKLDKIYETNHNEYILDMLENIRKKPKTYTDSIGKLFDVEKIEKDIKYITGEFEDLVKEPYRFKVEKGEPLGKLTKDILEEYGIDITTRKNKS